MIWIQEPSLKLLNASGKNTMVDHLGIEFTEVGEDYLIARMPVDERTKQPMGLLHGGASVALAETVGSVAATLMIKDFTKQSIVGVEINANHMSSARSGYVYGKVTALKNGRTLKVWNIDITDEDGKAICVSRLTTMVINRDKK